MNKSYTSIIILLLYFLVYNSYAQSTYPKWQVSGGSGLGFLLKQDNFKPNSNTMNVNNTNLNQGFSLLLKLSYYRNEHFGYGLGIYKFIGDDGYVILKNDPKTQYKELKNIYFSNTYGIRSLANYYSFISLKPFEDDNNHELNFETGIGLSRFKHSEIKGNNYNPVDGEIYDQNKDVFIYSQKRKGFGLLGKIGLEYFYHFKKTYLSLGIGVSYTTVPFNDYTENKILNQRIKNVSEINILDNQNVKLFQKNPNINPVNPNLLDAHIVFKLNPRRR